MKRFTTLAAVAGATALFSIGTMPGQADVTYDAQATITSPAKTTPPQVPPTYHTGSSRVASIPLASSNQFVSVSGGTPNGTLGVSYAMDLSCNGTICAYDSNSADPSHLVTLDANGNWRRNAGGTGSLSATGYSGMSGDGIASADSDITDAAGYNGKHKSDSAPFMVAR